jgi:hypothetical protein
MSLALFRGIEDEPLVAAVCFDTLAEAGCQFRKSSGCGDSVNK